MGRVVTAAAHECNPRMPRPLLWCLKHHRWHVIRLAGSWIVYAPNGKHPATYATHAEAIREADRQARKEQQ